MLKSVRYHILPAMLCIWAGFINLPKGSDQRLRKKRRFYFFHGGRGSGKSVGIADWIIDRARNESCRILCCRETQKSIKESVLELLSQRIGFYGLEGVEFEISKTEIRHLQTGSLIVFTGLKEHTSDSIKSFQSIKYCWVEEAHAVSRKSLKILIPTIRLPESSLIFTYNRFTESDPCHQLFRRELKVSEDKLRYIQDGKVYRWSQYQSDDAIGVYMNHDANLWFPDILKSEMDKEKADDHDSYLHIWKGQPIGQTVEAILSRGDIENAVERKIEAVGGEFVGVDVARYGDDASVFFKRKGLMVMKWEDYEKIDLVTLSNHLCEFVDDDKNIPIRIDDTGVGGGLTDIMNDRGYATVPINFNQVAQDEDKYDSAISEMWFHFRSIINESSIPDIQDLKEELAERKYTFDSKGRRKVEPKRDFKKRIGRSPDKVDSMLLSFYDIGGGVVMSDFSSNETTYINQIEDDY